MAVQLQFKPQPLNRLREKFPAPSFHDDGGRGRLTEEGFKLLSGLLTLNPEKRLTAAEALQSKWCGRLPASSSREAGLLQTPVIFSNVTKISITSVIPAPQAGSS